MIIRVILGVLIIGMIDGQMRDDSGLINIFEISKIADKICVKEKKIRGMLENPLLFGQGIKFLRFPIPLLPGPSRFTPLYVFESLIDRLSHYEDLLSAYLESKTPGPTKASLTQHPNHTNIEMADVLSAADFVCRTTHLWFDIIATKVSDLIGIWHIRLPVPDFKHSLNLHAFDLLDIFGIMDRIRRLFSGKLGLQTSTAPPGIFSSLFQKHKSTTESHGLLSSLFNTATTRPTTTKKPGLFDALFPKPTTPTSSDSSPNKKPTKPSGFLSSLFKQNPSSSSSFETSTTTTTKSTSLQLSSLFIPTSSTTKRSAGLLANLLNRPDSKSKTSTNTTVKPLETPMVKFSNPPLWILTTTFGRDPVTFVNTNHATRRATTDIVTSFNDDNATQPTTSVGDKIILPTAKTYTINLNVLDRNETKINRNYFN